MASYFDLQYSENRGSTFIFFQHFWSKPQFRILLGSKAQ